MFAKRSPNSNVHRLQNKFPKIFARKQMFPNAMLLKNKFLNKSRQENVGRCKRSNARLCLRVLQDRYIFSKYHSHLLKSTLQQNPCFDRICKFTNHSQVNLKYYLENIKATFWSSLQFLKHNCCCLSEQPWQLFA